MRYVQILRFLIHFFDVLNLYFFILKINFENRFLADNGYAYKMSVDGTDFKINQPQKFGKIRFFHLFRGPELRYKVAQNIQTVDIVWNHGLFLPGAQADLAIFFQGLAHKLKPGERVEADKGYRGWPRFVDCPNTNVGSGPLQRATKASVHSRHDLCNCRLKTFTTAILARSTACISKHTYDRATFL